MTTYCIDPNSTWIAVYNLNTGTMPTNNVVFSHLAADLSASATSITLKTGEGALFTQGMIATIEQLDATGKQATAREVVLISGISGDTLTLTRGYENCVQDDTASPKELGNTPLAFTSGARISVYVSRALLNGVQTRLQQVNCPCNTSVYNQAIALSSCVNNNYDDLWNGVVQKYYECCGDYGYGLGCDGDCVVEGIEYLDADKIYQFCNLTICEGGCIRFIKYGVPQIYVKEKFINNGVLDLRGGMFVGNCSLTRCGKTISNKGCLACYQALCNGCGGEGGYGPAGRGCTGCNNASAICGGKGGHGGWNGDDRGRCGEDGANADGPNGGQGGLGGYGYCGCCGAGGGGGGGGGDFGNGGRGGQGGYGYWGRTNYGRGLGGSGGNAGIFGRGGDGGPAGSGCNYGGTDGGSRVGGKGGNGWCGGHGGVGDNGWGGNAGAYGFQGGKGGDGGDGIVCGGNGGGGNGNCGGNGGKAITNVYALFLAARIICNNGSICGKGGNGGNGGYGTGHCSCGCPRKGGDGGCGGNGGDILTVSENYAVVGDINVAGGTGGTGGTSNYGSAGSNGANGTAGCHHCLIHILH